MDEAVEGAKSKAEHAVLYPRSAPIGYSFLWEDVVPRWAGWVALELAGGRTEVVGLEEGSSNE